MKRRLAEPDLEQLERVHLPRHVVPNLGQEPLGEHVAVLVYEQLLGPVDVDQVTELVLHGATTAPRRSRLALHRLGLPRVPAPAFDHASRLSGVITPTVAVAVRGARRRLPVFVGFKLRVALPLLRRPARLTPHVVLVRAEEFIRAALRAHQHRHDASDGILSFAKVLLERRGYHAEDDPGRIQRSKRPDGQPVLLDYVRRRRAGDEQTPLQRAAQR